MRAMHRPTRKLKNLIAKTERKRARSRLSGAKAKRWAKHIEQFKPLVEGADDSAGEKPDK